MSTSTSASLGQRVAYHNGILLDASDFQQEQSYHSSRLALALTQIHGFGTIAGLKVEQVAGGPAGPDGEPNPPELLMVRAGIALDRAGHLIEIAVDQSLRLNRWMEFQAAQPAADLKPYRGAGARRYFVGDLFLRFAEFPQGLRPGFPEPAADATDAIVSSRTDDGFELTLIARDCEPENTLPAVPKNRFPASFTDKPAVLAAIYAAYGQKSPDIDREYPEGSDLTAVFLSRVLIRLEDAPSTSLLRHDSGEVEVADLDRPIVVPSDLLKFLLPA
jgi:hypothetical protein